MPTLSVTKTYQDGDILTEADLDNIRQSIEEWANTTKLDSDNVQAGGIGVVNIGIDDGDYLEFGASNDGRIGVAGDDLYIENVTADKDIIFKINDGGVVTEVMRVDGSESTLVMNNKQIKGLADGVLDTDAATLNNVKSAIPAGSIIAYGAAAAPTGWLVCDGSAVSRTTYAALFAVIAETAGEGNNLTTFNVPDLRGRFLRGVDSGAGRDPDAAGRTAMGTGGASGDAVFSLQADGLASHTHVLPIDSSLNPGGTYFASTAGTTGPSTKSQGPDGGGTETRPKNANVQYIIKY